MAAVSEARALGNGAASNIILMNGNSKKEIIHNEHAYLENMSLIIYFNCLVVKNILYCRFYT